MKQDSVVCPHCKGTGRVTYRRRYWVQVKTGSGWLPVSRDDSVYANISGRRVALYGMPSTKVLHTLRDARALYRETPTTSTGDDKWSGKRLLSQHGNKPKVVIYADEP